MVGEKRGEVMFLENIVVGSASHVRQTVNNNIRETREMDELYAREDDLRLRVARAAYRQIEQCKISMA